jgi:hypothetical protein
LNWNCSVGSHDEYRMQRTSCLTISQQAMEKIVVGANQDVRQVIS